MYSYESWLMCESDLEILRALEKIEFLKEIS